MRLMKGTAEQNKHAAASFRPFQLLSRERECDPAALVWVGVIGLSIAVVVIVVIVVAFGIVVVVVAVGLVSSG